MAEYLGSRGNIALGSTEETAAIYEYVRNQRANINRYPLLLPAIQSFESWYQGLSWFEKYVMTNDTFNEAVRRRDAINAIMNQKTPDDYIPADAAQTAPPEPTITQKLFDTPTRLALAVGAGAIGLLVIANTVTAMTSPRRY